MPSLTKIFVAKNKFQLNPLLIVILARIKIKINTKNKLSFCINPRLEMIKVDSIFRVTLTVHKSH